MSRLRTPRVVRRHPKVFTGIAVAMGLAVVGWVYGTLVQDVPIVNDTSETYEISGCGDPVTVRPHATSRLELLTYEANQCQLYRGGDTARPDGCLVVTQRQAKAGHVTFYISKERSATEKTCR